MEIQGNMWGQGWIAERFNLYKSKIGHENAEEFYNDAVNKKSVKIALFNLVINIINPLIILRLKQKKWSKTSTVLTIRKKLYG